MKAAENVPRWYSWDLPEIQHRPIEMRRLIIKQYVCREFGCMLSELISKIRRSELVNARMVYAWLTRKHLGDTVTRIGLELEIDHSSASYFLKRMEKMIFVNDHSAKRMLKLESNIFKSYINETTRN